MKNEILVSIIIINYSGRNFLEKCLNSIQNTVNNNFEVIVVDNNSNDDSIAFLEKNFPKIKLLKLDRNYGFAIPNNKAAKIAKGKYLIFLNNDTVVSPGWLSELVKTLELDKSITIGQSLILDPNGKIESSGDFVNSLGIAFSDTEPPESIKPILSARAACMIIGRDNFLKLGGFDETFFASFEDVELGWRAWLMGYRVVIIPKSKVYHFGGQTVKKLSKTIAFHGAKNYLSLLIIFLEFRKIIKIIFQLGFLTLTRGSKLNIPKKDKTRIIFSIPEPTISLKAFLWILKNFIKIIQKRQKIQSNKVLSNDDLRKLGLIQS